MAAAATTTQPNEPVERLPQINEIIVGERTRRKYRLLSIIGDGGYGTVFEATDDMRKVAVKTEKYTKSMLHIEANVLRSANLEHCKHIVEMIDHGTVRPDYCYLVMPLLGRDLHRLRNEQKERRFGLATSIRIGIQTMQSLQELHEKCGYLSRDIKPGNFATGHPQSLEARNIYLIDFGLARKYIDKNKNVLPSRKEVGWRGTTRYGSLQAHLKQDLGRKDDVESWFYMFVEISKGALPWRSITERNAVHAAKLSARTLTRAAFLADCPKEFDSILQYIDSLTFCDPPSYNKIYGSLEEVLTRHNISWQQPYDWEDEASTTQSTRNTSASDNEQRAHNVDRMSREALQRPH